MREIKFRARNAGVPRCWIYGYFVVEEGYCYIVNNQGRFMVVAGTEGQYTSLNDKNKKEIYDRDICKFEIKVFSSHANISYLIVIEFKHSSWGFRYLFPEQLAEEDRKWAPFWVDEDQEMWNANYFEVIGNVYENPELLDK